MISLSVYTIELYDTVPSVCVGGGRGDHTHTYMRDYMYH